VSEVHVISGTRRAMKEMALLERFNAKWTLNQETGCHEWHACLLPRGYGAIQRDGKKIAAHRVSWELHHGPITGGLHVLHRCDNRKCVNPAHLFLGTHQDNMRDRDQKGRQARRPGELNPMAKLTDAQREAMAAEYLAGKERVYLIAEKYGVCHRSVLNSTDERIGRVGYRNGRAKLNIETAAKIREMSAAGEAVNAIARQTGLSWPTVKRVLNGESFV
jgi:hypothetical protein